MKSLYNLTKAQLSATELLAYMMEDKDECDFKNLDLTLSEVDEISPDLKEFDQWLSKQKVTRKVTYLAVHCTASQPEAKVASIVKHWKSLGWKKPGYHILIAADGSYTVLSDFNDPTNGVLNYNHNTIHISYIGGINKAGKPFDSRTDAQKKTLKYIVGKVSSKYKLEVKGHRDFEGVRKACPSFEIKNL